MKTITTTALILLISLTSISQSHLDAYINNASKNNFVKIGAVTNSISNPVDLDFHHDMVNRPFELWVVSKGTSNSGGTTVVITDADSDTPTHQYVKDGNAWHFMALPSAIAFGDNDNWATSQDILDANRNGGKFTGPTLWSSDLSIYGVVGNPPNSNYNGSHLDMIHQSPYGKGIAWETENVYWIIDGYDNTLKRYDFKSDHGPGQTSHDDGEVRVYSDVSITKDFSLPSHIVIDENKNYLYGCNTGGNSIFRVDITTGSYNKNLTKINNEPLAEYSEYTSTSVEEIITLGLNKPVGIDVVDNHLIVTDNGNEEIVIYDLADFSEIGRITLPYSNPDLMGVKVGPDGKIYFVDYTSKSVYRIENDQAFPLSTAEISNDIELRISPNPARNSISIISSEIPNNIDVKDMNGRVLMALSPNSLSNVLDISELRAGIYIVQSIFNKVTLVQKIVVK